MPLPTQTVPARDLTLHDPNPVRTPLAALVVGVALLPFLNPKGPGNSAPVDPVMIVGIALVLVWAAVSRTRLHVPYVVPAACLVLAGATAALVSHAPVAGATAVFQELFLLAWCAAITNLCRTPDVLATVLRAWCLAATAWAAFLVGAVFAGHPTWAGMPGPEGGRAALLFDHPNMSGNYFMVSILVVSAARYPRRRWARVGVYAVLGLAMIFAGSNTALLSLPVALLFVAFVKIRRRTEILTASIVVLCIAIAGAAAWTVVKEPVTAAVQSSDNMLVKASVARSSRSASARQGLFADQFELYRSQSLIGLGPAGTRSALDREPVKTAKESHNDYLATLVERGPLGVVALIMLVAAVAVRAAGVNRLSPAFQEVVPNPAAIAGAMITFIITALTHEVLHYRHLWTLFAFLAALHLFGRGKHRLIGVGAGPVVASLPRGGRRLMLPQADAE